MCLCIALRSSVWLWFVVEGLIESGRGEKGGVGGGRDVWIGKYSGWGREDGVIR